MLRTCQQFERLQAIHNKLATGQRYTLDDLRNACTLPGGGRPSARTLYDDIRKLREEYGAPIPDRDRSGRPYYYRPGERFSLYGAFNPDDAALANEAAALLKQVAHLPQFAGLEDIFLKFEQRAGVVGNVEKRVVQAEQNTDYQGLKWLKPLYDAIRQDYPILIDYQDFTADAPTRYEVSPYLLKEYNNRWFLLGAAEGWPAGRPFPLDRIQVLIALPGKRRRPDRTDWDAEFADVVGVTRIAEHPVETLTLRVMFPRARYVATKPLHPSQQEGLRTERYVEFSYALRWNPELVSKILELGPDAELISPAHRRAELAKLVRRLVKVYE